MKREDAIFFVKALLALRAGARDDRAAACAVLFPVWRPERSYAAGERVRFGAGLYKCLQGHTSQTGWEPGGAAASLWSAVSAAAGSAGDPVSYSGGMELEAGLYYSQDGQVYLCTRSTGAAVYGALSELVGIYVTAV